MSDTEGGLQVDFYDVQNSTSGLGTVANFVMTNVASNLDRTVPHTIKIEMDFVDGPSNDGVTVTVDGTYSVTGTSWEDYFRYDPESVAEQSTRTVDSILFRTSAAAPLTLGNGFYVDNLSVTTGASAPATEKLSTLTEELVTNPGAERALLASLQRTQNFLDAGQPFRAYMSMLQYVLLVNRFDRANIISDDAAQQLYTQALNLTRSIF
jgi:hypothetical protein